MMAATPDFYAVLGVPKTADQQEIQRAYRKLAREYHPDVNKDPGAEERFKQISEAYDVLSDPETRRRYDAFGPEFRQVPSDVDPDAWRRARAGAGAGRAGAGQRPGGGVWFEYGEPGGPVGFEDLFGGTPFGSSAFGGRTRRGWGPIRGADQEVELEVTVEEAYRGGRRSITLDGRGGPRKLDMRIPAGVTDGQRIRLAGQGGQGSDGAQPGDLYLVVRIAPHPRYRVEGRDLHVDLPLAPWEAALGATVAVDTPAGEAKVKVPPGTSSGRRLRLRGRGLPNPRGKPGDLYADVRVVVPKTPSEQERRAYQQLAAVSTSDPRRQR